MRHAGVLCTVLAMVIGGCGGDDADSAKKPVEVYFSALADGDGEKACEQISGEAQREMVGQLSGLVPEAGAATCPDAVEALAGNLGLDEKALLEDAAFKVTLDGDRATVAPDGGTEAADVEKIDGRWLITGGLTGSGETGGSEAPTTDCPYLDPASC